METEPIGSSISSSISTAPSISSVPSFGGEIGSAFSLADTVPFSAPTEISLGCIFQPGFNFADTRPFMPSDIELVPLNLPSGISESLSDINLDPDLPEFEIPEAFRVSLAEINLDPDIPDSEVPQVFYDAFAKQELLEPQPYFERINIVDIPVETSNNPIIEQINNSSEPEIVQTEARFDVDSLWSMVNSSNQEELTDYRLPSIVEPTIEKVAEELIKLSETPVILAEEIEDLTVLPQSEISQAVVTYESLKTAGIEEIQAVEVIQNALVIAGTTPEVAKKILIQIKTDTKTAAKIGSEIKNEAPAAAKALADKEEKKEVKFVVDEKALASRNNALIQPVEMAPAETGTDESIIDSSKVASLMPTEVQSPGVISGILPKYFLEILNLGDGAYRSAVALIKKLGVLSKGEILKKGLEINRDLPPVTTAPGGKEVGEQDVKRVISHQKNPIPPKTASI